MNLILVFLGGGLGSLIRYSISNYFQTSGNEFPKATLLANLISCLIAGILVASLPKSAQLDQYKALLLTGFCGGFSTFSAFSTETIQLILVGNHWTAFNYVFFSLLGGLLTMYFGFKITAILL